MIVTLLVIVIIAVVIVEGLVFAHGRFCVHPFHHLFACYPIVKGGCGREGVGGYLRSFYDKPERFESFIIPFAFCSKDTRASMPQA